MEKQIEFPWEENYNSKVNGTNIKLPSEHFLEESLWDINGKYQALFKVENIDNPDVTKAIKIIDEGFISLGDYFPFPDGNKTTNHNLLNQEEFNREIKGLVLWEEIFDQLKINGSLESLKNGNYYYLETYLDWTESWNEYQSSESYWAVFLFNCNINAILVPHWEKRYGCRIDKVRFKK